MLSQMAPDSARVRESFLLDRIDAQLLLALGEDARVSVTELASTLGLSRNTVQAHLLRLQRHDLLRFGATLGQVRATGHAVMAFVTIDIAQECYPGTAAGLAAIPEVIEAYGITGDGDLFCRVVATDAADLGRVLERVSACPGVRRTRTSLAIRDAVGLRVDSVLRGLS
jgi:DNA-binding Lrp family transcriptional regulator